MNNLRIWCITVGVLFTAPMTASFAQGGGQGDLDSLLGPAPTTSSPSTAPTAATQQPAGETNPADTSSSTGNQAEAGSSVAAAPSATANTAGPAAIHPANSTASTATGATKTAKVKSTPVPQKASASRMVEEIVVTAEKREENIQDVPIAITAFSAGKLEAMGVQTVEDLPNVTPGLTITNAAGYNVVYLRGVGTDAFLPGADPSVPFYLDGVPLLGTQGSSDALGRIKRVEVLKGPQGTLFGRSSVGGAINIITPDPTDDLDGSVELSYGNYNARKVQGYVNVPITDKIAASISAFGSKQTNFYTNDTGPIIGVYSWGGRAKVRWDITDNLSTTFAGSYQQNSGNGGLSFENTRVAPDFAAVLPQDPKADRHYSFDSLSGARNNSYLVSDTTDWKLPMVEIKAIGSAQRLNAGFVQSDFDKSDLPIVNIFSVKQVSNQYTGELQFLSTPGTPLSDHFTWVGGLFYLYSSGGFDPIEFKVAPNAVSTLGGTLLGGAGSTLGGLLTSALNPITQLAGINLNNGITLLNHGVLAGSSLAAYFQGTVKLTDELNLILGVRYQHAHRDLEGSRTGIPLPGAPGGELDLLSNNVPTLYANQVSPRVGLQWRPFGPETQIYTSWARGYKNPTYNTVNLLGTLVGPINPVIQEKVDSYELGIKTELFDNTLRLNSALFYTEEKDLLTGFVALLSGGIVSYDTTPGARIKGAEGDALWTPLPDLDPGLVLTASATYLDAKYTDYPNGKGFDTATGLAFGNGGTELLPARDFRGNRVVRTPNLTYNAGISQTFPVLGGSLETAMDVAYNSGFFFLPQDTELYARQSYYLLNGHITYIYKPLGAELTVFAKNILNTDYNESVFVDDFGRNQVLNPPRTYGVRLKWSFGAT